MATLLEELKGTIDEIMPGMVADRRWMHEHPELGFHEVETSKFVIDRLRQLGVEEIKTGIAVTGVTGLIRGTGNGPGADKVVLVRADMDALPIHEENAVDYRSTAPGVMHACGHDGHTAMLLALSRILIERKSEWAGTVKVLFQPAEEIPPGGANPMIQAGVLENPHVDAVFGLHIAQDRPIGQIELRDGPTMASADRCTIVIQGKGGHGASPHRCIDPIAIGAQIVTALQTIVSREVDPVEPAVVTVGAFLAGDAPNVIPDSAELRLTIRSFSPAVRDQLETRITALVTGIAEAMRATVKIDYERGYPSTVNDPEMSDIVRAAAAEVVGVDGVINGSLHMGAEDFSYFLIERPGSFFFVGSNNAERGLSWSHHHPRFDFDEEALGIGVDVMARTVLGYLNRQ